MRRLMTLVVVVALLAPTAAIGETPMMPRLAAEPATVIVGVADEHRAAVHGRLGYRVANRIAELSADIVEVPAHQVAAAIARYQQLPGVRYAEPNRVVSINAATPNDSFWADQYALRRIRAPRGWARYGRRWRATGGARIAIIDTGIDTLHPELAGKISHCRNWLTGLGIGAPGCQDLQFHGTHVAGIAAATTNNRTGIAGVAFDSPIMALQAFNSTGRAFTADVVAAMVYAAQNGARVINYSFSSDQRSNLEQDAVGFVHRRKVTQVAAAGNTGRAGVQYPARWNRVIAVSATNSADRLAGFSTYGSQVEVAAPGAGILSTLPGTVLYGEMDGTSMAAPHVAGLAALLRSKGYSMRQTRLRIRRGANDLGPAGRDARFGFGRINANRSLRPGLL